MMTYEAIRHLVGLPGRDAAFMWDKTFPLPQTYSLDVQYMNNNYGNESIFRFQHFDSYNHLIKKIAIRMSHSTLLQILCIVYLFLIYSLSSFTIPLCHTSLPERYNSFSFCPLPQMRN
jgi:hypothetical protein